MHDTEDRQWWYQYGERKELEFVNICNNVGMDIHINPEKSHDKTQPDIIANGRLADLKYQSTPFFTSNRYGLNPQYAITFNIKDYNRYLKLYPDIDLYFWVEWKQLQYRNLKVNPMSGIWFTNLNNLDIETYPIHAYMRRANGTGNAKASYLIDLRTLERKL